MGKLPFKYLVFVVLIFGVFVFVVFGGENGVVIPKIKEVGVENIEVANVVSGVSRSVVSIVNSRDGDVRGSGFLFDSFGLLITNRHVVDDEIEYSAILSDGSKYSAEVLARDTVFDLAVLKIEGGDFPVVEFGDSSSIRVGQMVIAVGQDSSVGVISTKDSSLVVDSPRGGEEVLNGLIQTSVIIHPGDSGGPLVNFVGEVVGVNVAVSPTAGGMGFAIPIDDVKFVVKSVREHGRIIRPFLGVRFITLTPEKAQKLKIEVEYGAFLVGDPLKGEFAVISDSPAAKAGLEMGDVILEVDGEKVTVENPLDQMVVVKSVGDKVGLKVWRSGEVVEVVVELEENE